MEQEKNQDPHTMFVRLLIPQAVNQKSQTKLGKKGFLDTQHSKIIIYVVQPLINHQIVGVFLVCYLL